MKNKIKYVLFFLLLALLVIIAGCANVSAPSGGLGNKQPPIVKTSSIQNGTLNYSGSGISIEFNSYMNRSSVTDNIIVSPTASYTYKWSAKELNLFWTEKLKPTTTYSIQLSGGYTDYYGNKSSTPFYVVFSTGDMIDTGKIMGSIVTDKPEGYYIFCYVITDGTENKIDYIHKVPDYKALVANDKSFIIPALSDGIYRIIAVKDIDRDGVITPLKDSIGIPIFDPVIARQNSVQTILMPSQVYGSIDSAVANNADTIISDTSNVIKNDIITQQADTIVKAYQRLAGTVKISEDIYHKCNNSRYLVIKSNNEKYQTELRVDNTYLFPKVLAGEYSIMYFCDVNENGEYDDGLLDPFVFAEPFIMVKQNVVIKPHWNITDYEVIVE